MEREEAISRLKTLVGHDLHIVAKEYEVTVVGENGKMNKGWAGHAIERHLGLPLNSSRDPNFGSWELKVIPLRYLKNGSLVFKETMAITMLDEFYVAHTPFEKSHLLNKLKKLLIVARIVGSSNTDPSVVFSATPTELNGSIYTQVEIDYEEIRKCINDSRRGFKGLSGKMGELIQPRTKGKGHGSTSRAFYAKKAFLEHCIDLSTGNLL